MPTPLILDARGRKPFPVYLRDIPSKGIKKGARRAYRTRRAIDSIDALGFHHWGARVSTKPLKGETVADALIRRALQVPYHVSIFREGFVVAWPFDLVTWHGGALNRRSIGVGVAGLFSLAGRDEGTDDPAEFYPALDAFLAWAAEHVPKARLLLTHSQVESKPSDPGEGIARRLHTAPEHMTMPGYFLKPGAPWPPSWRGEGV